MSMLRWIRVRNIAVIDELEVNFEPGLNLLTGETGAGKSILVDALGLVLGSRASSDLVRTGAPSAQVEAAFELTPVPHGLRDQLDSAGIDVEEGELVIRREVAASGRSRIAVNGCAGAASLLRRMAPYLADIHGQGENLSLLRPEAGLDLLDRLGHHETLGKEVGQHYRRLLELEHEKSELEREAKDKQARRELLELQIAEIQRAHIQPGEVQSLEEERRLLVHQERLRTAAEEAYRELYEKEDSVLAGLAQVWKRVAELAEIDSRYSPFLENQPSVSSQLEDLALFLRDYREQIRFSPGRLDEVEDRLALLERLQKKYGGSLEAVVSHYEHCQESLGLLETSEERLEHIRLETETTAESYLSHAKKLSAKRTQTAGVLEKRVERELRSLAMEKARFAIQVSSTEGEAESRATWQDRGLDEVELLFSANPGEELRPIAKIASGGESSRFMLALKSVASRGEQARSLVFDEVDTGIEGRVANVVGEKLKHLSRSHQVICITHLPQIASFADVHYRIEKRTSQGRTSTHVEFLDRQGRVDEIARMIAGSEITETARMHAEQLVSDKS